MLHPSHNLPPHLRPVYTPIELFIHAPDDRHVITPHQIQAVLDARRVLVVLFTHRPDDAFDSILQYKVCLLVVGGEGAEQGAAVGGED